jgi:hypothetical protein
VMTIDEQLKHDAMSRGGSFPRQVNPFTRTVALWRGALAGESRVEGRARYLHELVKLASIEIDVGWTLAGNHLPTEGHGLPLPDATSAEDVRLMAALGVDVDDFSALVETLNRWDADGEGHRDETANDRLGAGPWGDHSADRVFIGGGWVENHSIRDFEKVMRIGFDGIRQEI